MEWKRSAKGQLGLEEAASHDEKRPANSLTEHAYRELEELIVTLQLPPGEVLSEMDLAKRFGVGRTPIREALQRLAHEGLVVILPRRGVLVSEVNIHTHLMLLEVRREIERLMVRAACHRATESERAQLAEIAEGLEEAAERADDVGFMRLDKRLNAVIANACHNEFAAKAIGLISGLTRRFWYMHYQKSADLPHCARLHAELTRAISSRNEKAAVKACDRLIDYIEGFTRATLDTARLP